MGEVYRAHDTRLGRQVAVKVVLAEFSTDADRLARFEREARAASALNHPHIVTVHDVGSFGSGTYIVMELVEGETLRELLALGSLPTSKALDIAAQVADGLASAHRAGIVHRDLKPDNIMITGDGVVKILDFGVAKLREPEADISESPTRTASGVVIGTAGYMSPEQSRGDPVDFRSDQFAFGAILYEMAAGKKAFGRRTTADTLAAILREEPDPLEQANPATPAPLRWIVQRCLAKDPQGRYASTRDLAAELKGLREHLPELSIAATAREARRQGPILKRRAVAAAAVGLSLLLALAVWLTRRGHPSPEASPPERTTLAVLPFRALNAPDEIGFLGLGIPDAIITRLANARRIRVRPTTLVLRYENRDVDPREAGRALQSEHVLAGTLQKVEDRLGVSVQLVRVEDGVTLWGERFDLPRSDLLHLQDTIGARVTAALGVQMTEAERQRLRRRYTANAEAYERYLRGRSSLTRFTEAETRDAIAAFETALNIDPGYALAHAGLAMASARMHIRFAPDPAAAADWGQRAKQQASAALKLDPQLAEAHEALADVYGNTDFDWEGTISESRRALELNPSIAGPHLLLGWAFYHLGLLDLVEAEVSAAIDIDPGAKVEPLRVRGTTALLSGRFAQALPLLEQGGRVRGSTGEWYLAQGLHYAGEAARAEAMLRDLRGSSQGQVAARAQATLASFLAARGDKAEAAALVRIVTSGRSMDHHVAYALGAAYAQLGDRSAALRWLIQAADTGFPCHPWYVRDPLLDPLRGDPEFERFMGQLRASWEAARVRYGPGTAAS
jgi:TolB-like protein